FIFKQCYLLLHLLIVIPNFLHFVFGMAPDFGGKPFSLVHYLSVKSAVELNKPSAAYFHYQYEPAGEWWENAKSLLTLNRIVAPDSFMGRPLFHVAHKADVVRLQMLKEYGGIYMDLDTISVKPLTNLLDHSFVIGKELKPAYEPKNWRQRLKYKLGLINVKEGATGLCNAVLLSEKESDFINLWLKEYKNFRSGGRDKYWNEHSVLVPERLAADHREMITQLSPHVFHYPLYNTAGLKSMFEEVSEFPEAYLHHLWESFSWNKYLSKLTVGKIKAENTTFNLIARKYL
ncbi:MAG: glycosyltransferase, partial [Chitinophagaceae bacterium]